MVDGTARLVLAELLFPVTARITIKAVSFVMPQGAETNNSRAIHNLRDIFGITSVCATDKGGEGLREIV
jgi:hypothetical protein